MSIAAVLFVAMPSANRKTPATMNIEGGFLAITLKVKLMSQPSLHLTREPK